MRQGSADRPIEDMTMSDDGPKVARDLWVADLYRAHAPALLRYLTARVGSAAAEDLTAETFIVAIRHHEVFDQTRGTSRAWLFGIASNAVRDHFRHEARYLRVVSRAEGQPWGGTPGVLAASASWRRMAGREFPLAYGARCGRGWR